MKEIVQDNLLDSAEDTLDALDNYAAIIINLDSPDGNSMAIMSACKKVLKAIGRPDLIQEYLDKAMSGDRQNVLEVTREYSQGLIGYTGSEIDEDDEYWDEE